MRTIYYKLVGDEVVPMNDPREWVQWWESNHPHKIANDEINGVRISTVFLGCNHNAMFPVANPDLLASAPPILFETMIFGGAHDHFQERYSTIQEAREGHKIAVDLVLREVASSK